MPSSQHYYGNLGKVGNELRLSYQSKLVGRPWRRMGRTPWQFSLGPALPPPHILSRAPPGGAEAWILATKSAELFTSASTAAASPLTLSLGWGQGEGNCSKNEPPPYPKTGLVLQLADGAATCRDLLGETGHLLLSLGFSRNRWMQGFLVEATSSPLLGAKPQSWTLLTESSPPAPGCHFYSLDVTESYRESN